MGRRVHGCRSEDDTLKLRRERNRQAQHDFRVRRQAAEEAQQHRVQHLEATVEKLSGVIVGFCDDVLTLPEVAGQPELMGKLQRSMTEALRLAQSVVDSNDSHGYVGGHDVAETMRQGGSSTEVQEPSSRQHPSPHGDPEQSTADSDSNQSQASANTASHASTSQSSQTSSTSLGLHFSPYNNTLAPLQNLDGEAIKPFPLRLVEATLLRACMALSDLTLPPERIKRDFGNMIGPYCTREELLSRARWLLGPGYSEIYSVAGANWKPSYVDSFDGYDFGSSAFPGASDYKSSEKMWESIHSRTQRDEFMTALQVATQLESLGASFANPDTIELRLGEDNDARRYPATDHTSATQRAIHQPGMMMRINSLLLTTNLSSVAECVGFGPVYPRSQIAKAVEASIVFAWNN